MEPPGKGHYTVAEEVQRTGKHTKAKGSKHWGLCIWKGKERKGFRVHLKYHHGLNLGHHKGHRQEK
eukprot:scaffold146479_cov18-Tisochrysis_lutea.AAC.1